jgi:hypothetical protein
MTFSCHLSIFRAIDYQPKNLSADISNHPQTRLPHMKTLVSGPAKLPFRILGIFSSHSIGIKKIISALSASLQWE